MTTSPPLFESYPEGSRNTLSLEGARAVPQENPDSIPASQDCQIWPVITGQTFFQSFFLCPNTEAQPWLPRLADGCVRLQWFYRTAIRCMGWWPTRQCQDGGKGIQGQGKASVTWALGKSPPGIQVQPEGGSTLLLALGTTHALSKRNF